MTLTETRYDARTRFAADELNRLRDSRVGADRWNPGKFAIYFYDEDEIEIRSAGRFESPHDAAMGRWCVLVEAVTEALADFDANDVP